MARILFRVTYKIPMQQRNNYLELAAILRNKYANSGVECSVFEVKGKPYFFQEVYMYSSPEQYDAADEIAEQVGADKTIAEIAALAGAVEYEAAEEI